MKVLGLDTSHYLNSVGIIEGERLLAGVTSSARSDSLVKIIANIDFAVKRAGLTLAQIDGFGVGLGPGSWTGIRVGVTVGKMLAYATGKPICGVSTLEALAREAFNANTLICSIIGGGTKDMIYAALYRQLNGAVKQEGDYYVGSPSGLAHLIKENVVIVGQEADFYAEYIKSLNIPDIKITEIKTIPQGSTIASLAQARLERGDKDNALALTPLYLKESAARIYQEVK